MRNRVLSAYWMIHSCVQTPLSLDISLDSSLRDNDWHAERITGVFSVDLLDFSLRDINRHAQRMTGMFSVDLRDCSLRDIYRHA